MCCLRKRLGPMQLSSSSPQMISVGVGILLIASVSVKIDGRPPWSYAWCWLSRANRAGPAHHHVKAHSATALEADLRYGLPLRRHSGVAFEPVFDGRVVGGFKRSSQHLNEGGCNEPSKAPITPFWTGAASVTGAAASSGAI
jgi:hypothetical protein